MASHPVATRAEHSCWSDNDYNNNEHDLSDAQCHNDHDDDEQQRQQKRPRRSAKARREQRQRAEVRTIERVLTAYQSIQHRGNHYSKLGAAIKDALMTTKDNEKASHNDRQQRQHHTNDNNMREHQAQRKYMPVCRHYLKGNCTWSNECKLSHSCQPNEERRHTREHEQHDTQQYQEQYDAQHQERSDNSQCQKPEELDSKIQQLYEQWRTDYEYQQATNGTKYLEVGGDDKRKRATQTHTLLLDEHITRHRPRTPTNAHLRTHSTDSSSDTVYEHNDGQDQRAGTDSYDLRINNEQVIGTDRYDLRTAQNQTIGTDTDRYGLRIVQDQVIRTDRYDLDIVKDKVIRTDRYDLRITQNQENGTDRRDIRIVQNQMIGTDGYDLRIVQDQIEGTDRYDHCSKATEHYDLTHSTEQRNTPVSTTLTSAKPTAHKAMRQTHSQDTQKELTHTKAKTSNQHEHATAPCKYLQRSREAARTKSTIHNYTTKEREATVRDGDTTRKNNSEHQPQPQGCISDDIQEIIEILSLLPPEEHQGMLEALPVHLLHEVTGRLQTLAGPLQAIRVQQKRNEETLDNRTNVFEHLRRHNKNKKTTRRVVGNRTFHAAMTNNTTSITQCTLPHTHTKTNVHHNVPPTHRVLNERITKHMTQPHRNRHVAGYQP